MRALDHPRTRKLRVAEVDVGSYLVGLAVGVPVVINDRLSTDATNRVVVPQGGDSKRPVGRALITDDAIPHSCPEFYPLHSRRGAKPHVAIFVGPTDVQLMINVDVILPAARRRQFGIDQT